MDLSSFVAADQQPSIGQIGVGVGVFVGVLVKTGVAELVGVRDVHPAANPGLTLLHWR